MSINPMFTLLKEVVDPVISAVSPDRRPSDDPVIKLFGLNAVQGIQIPTSGKIEFFAYKSKPGVVIGDTLEYASVDSRDIATGVIKLKKITESISIPEDVLQRIRQNQKAALNILQNSVQNMVNRNNEYFITQVRRTALSASFLNDPEVIDIFGLSSAGTVNNPSDLNSGSYLDYGAGSGSPLIITGASQSQYAMTTLIREAKRKFVVIDSTTKLQLPVNKIYIGMHPEFLVVLEHEFELLNSTTGQKSMFSYAQQLRSAGFELVPAVEFDPDYTGADSSDAILTFFADPEQNFYLDIAPVADGLDAWSDWTAHRQDAEDGHFKIIYEKHKALEYGFHAVPYYFNDTFIKPVLKAKVQVS